MNPKALFQLVKETFHEWSEDKAPRLGAALAYYSVFSIAPLLLLTIAAAGLVFGKEAASGAIVGEIEDTVGKEVAQAVAAMLQQASDPQSGTLATLIGVVTLLFGASGVFGQLQDALNTIWKVTPKPGRGLRGIIRDRLLSFTVVLGTGFLLLVSLVVSAALSALSKFSAALPGSVYLWQVINLAVSLGFITLLFAMIYKILPDVEIAWRDVWTGAAVTALLFTAGKYLLGVYLGQKSVTSPYGAAGSLVVILLWVYYSSQILLFGAEFTRVQARRRGSVVRTSDNAVPVTNEERERQGMPRGRDVEAVARQGA